MDPFTIIDTVPEFLFAWRRWRDLPVEEQVGLWEEFYGRSWPDLLEMQKTNYKAAGLSWRRIAIERIFPELPYDLRDVRRAHALLITEIPRVDARVRTALGLDVEVTYVLHVGIGCGAGWATRYGARPAVLFGIENIAAERWVAPGRLRSLIAHELAHLLQSELRRKVACDFPSVLRGPYRHLYEEGFATRFELEALGPRSSGSLDRDRGWSRWCAKNRERLAGAFLKSVRSHASTRPFFGSWYNIDGHIETGYWLGMEVIRELERVMTFAEIATLPAEKIRPTFVQVLETIAGGSAGSGPATARPPNR